MEKLFDRAYLEELAHKWRAGTLTNEEQAYFDKWYKSLPNDLLELPEGYAKNSIAIRDRMHKKLLQRVRASKGEGKIISLTWKRLLVAATTVAMLSVLFSYYLNHKSDSESIVSKPHPQYIPPGSNKAILTLANGKKINLDDSRNGTIAQQSGSVIQKQNGGLIAYQTTTNRTDTITEYNLMETPRGGQYRLVLSDGTKVWLNAASSLKYPSSFKGKQREVTLTGEGYFEVVHNAHQPFIVKTVNQTIKDIGTSFNVNTYTDEPHSTTTLIDGAIQLTDGDKMVLLRPGQQAINQASTITVSKAEIETATAWKNGQLAFHRNNIQNVLRQISRWYNIEIEYEGKAPEFTISGEVSRQADLSAMLRILQLLGRYSQYASQLFDGLVVDEIYMIRAEAGVRTGKLANAMTDLNTLLSTRWKPGTYNALTASSADDALKLILQERRKELCFRGLRWSDLRRLNKDPKYATTLTRELDGKTYTLKPNDNKYVYQIPAMETNFNTAIVQNPK